MTHRYRHRPTRSVIPLSPGWHGGKNRATPDWSRNQAGIQFLGGGDGERNSAMGRCHKGDDMRKRQKACGSAGAGGREEVGRELVCAPWWEELAGRTDFKSSHMKPT